VSVSLSFACEWSADSVLSTADKHYSVGLLLIWESQRRRASGSNRAKLSVTTFASVSDSQFI
jgi:hypothetical protein